MSQRVATEPYEATFCDSTGRFCVRGPERELRNLLAVTGSMSHYGPGYWFVSVPPIREAVLALEAVATLASVTDSYRRARDVIMATPDEWDRWVRSEAARLGMSTEHGQLGSHQVAAIAQACMNGRGILNGSEMGTGKTLVVTTLFALWGCRRGVVVASQDGCDDWMIDIEKFWPSGLGAPVVMLNRGRTDRRRRELLLALSEGALALVNYELVLPALDVLRQFPLDLIGIDESHMVKNPTAKRTKAIQSLADQATHVCAGSGTTIGNNVVDLYSQCRIVDRRVVPDTKAEFEAMYAVTKHIDIVAGERTISVPKIVGVRQPAELMSRISSIWFRATKATSLDLPPKVYEPPRVFDMPDEMWEWHQKIEEHGDAAIGNALALTSEAVVDLRLAQLCGGWLPRVHVAQPGLQSLEEMEDGPTTYERIKCHKRDWVMSLAERRLLPEPSTRLILWLRFRHEVEGYASDLQDLFGSRWRAVPVMGGVKDLRAIQESFNSRASDGVQVIVALIDKLYQSKNLQGGDLNVYCNHTWSHIKRTQSEDRTHRQGRLDSVGYIDLLYRRPDRRPSIDQKAIQAVAQKQDLHGRMSPVTVTG